MYVAVVTAIVGQAFGQPVLLGYSALVWVVMAAFVRWYEEPYLTQRFGRTISRTARPSAAGSPACGPGIRDQVATSSDLAQQEGHAVVSQGSAMSPEPRGRERSRRRARHQ
jgi:hypothetical protein